MATTHLEMIFKSVNNKNVRLVFGSDYYYMELYVIKCDAMRFCLNRGGARTMAFRACVTVNRSGECGVGSASTQLGRSLARTADPWKTKAKQNITMHTHNTYVRHFARYISYLYRILISK